MIFIIIVEEGLVINNMRTSKIGLEFIARWEGVVLHPYMDVAGLWTIGVGHLIKPTDSFSTIPNNKIKELMKSKDRSHPFSELLISREEALEILSKDIIEVEAALVLAIKVPLNQNQFDALVSFGFNCGPNVFRTSGACRALGAGNYNAVAERLLDWSKVRINGELRTNKGLLARRTSEGELFNRTPVVPVDPHEVPTIVSWTKEILLDTQTRLKMLGFYPGVIDGIMGPATRKGIEEFSKTYNVGTGVDPKLGIAPSWLASLAQEAG
jgi:lysozyme